MSDAPGRRGRHGQDADGIESLDLDGAEAAEAEGDAPRDRRPRRTVLALVVGGVAILVSAALVVAYAIGGDAGGDDEAVATTVPVALDAAGIPDGTTIGVVLTLGSGAEGAEWSRAAQGAAVAERRLALGGADVTIVPADDRGSDGGAADAVGELVDAGVSGIVVASSGGHVRAAVDAADEAGIPVILPYAQASGDAWSTAPSERQIADALADAVGDAERPLHVDAGRDLPADVAVADTVELPADQPADSIAEDVAVRTGTTPQGGLDEDEEGAEFVAEPNDAVVVSGAPARLAAVVAALQAERITVPIVLTPEAASPAFASALDEAGGSAAGSIVTVGGDWGDATALRSDPSGRAMSAFLGGVRVLAQDGDATNLTEDAPFADVAGDADSRSHDAVLALARAAGEAGSNEPAAVADALAALTVGPADGIAGPALDLTSPSASTGRVGPLFASTQDLGLRPAGDGVRVGWFGADQAP